MGDISKKVFDSVYWLFFVNCRTKGKDNLSVQAFRDIFAENVTFGEKLHEFMLKVSTTDRVDVELFVDVCKAQIKKLIYLKNGSREKQIT